MAAGGGEPALDLGELGPIAARANVARYCGLAYLVLAPLLHLSVARRLRDAPGARSVPRASLAAAAVALAVALSTALGQPKSPAYLAGLEQAIGVLAASSLLSLIVLTWTWYGDRRLPRAEATADWLLGLLHLLAAVAVAIALIQLGASPLPRLL